MIETLIFEDEIRVYFDRVRTLAANESYVLLVDGREAQTSKKTHFTLKALCPQTEYALAVYLVGEIGRAHV